MAARVGLISGHSLMSDNKSQSAFPDYWDKALVYLAQRDRVMKMLIERYAHVPFYAHESVLTSILRAIVGQQISNKAAATLWERLCSLKFGQWDSFILVTPTSQFRSIGLNPRKIAAMKEVSWRWAKGDWSEAIFARMSDDQVIDAVQSIKGLGPWSAMSILIFALKRPDVFPLSDFGVRQALVNLYFPDENVISLSRSAAQSRVKLVANVWAPYRTVATWFLWRSLENTPAEKESE